MRTAYFDQDFHLDDPNLYLGNPSYLLEPGDAGYRVANQQIGQWSNSVTVAVGG